MSVKELYMGRCVKDLQALSKLKDDIEQETTDNLYSAARDIFKKAEENDIAKDEEAAYVEYFRLMRLSVFLTERPDYLEDRNRHQILSNDAMIAFKKGKDLEESLKKRYSMLETTVEKENTNIITVAKNEQNCGTSSLVSSESIKEVAITNKSENEEKPEKEEEKVEKENAEDDKEAEVAIANKSEKKEKPEKEEEKVETENAEDDKEAEVAIAKKSEKKEKPEKEEEKVEKENAEDDKEAEAVTAKKSPEEEKPEKKEEKVEKENAAAMEHDETPEYEKKTCVDSLDTGLKRKIEKLEEPDVEANPKKVKVEVDKESEAATEKKS